MPRHRGISAGGINAVHLGNHTSAFSGVAAHLVESWSVLELENIVEVESGFSMLGGFSESKPSSRRTYSSADVRHTHGLLDTTPLWNDLRDRLEARKGELTGVQQNLDEDRLGALALVKMNYATGQTVAWLEDEDVDV